MDIFNAIQANLLSPAALFIVSLLIAATVAAHDR